VFLNGAALFTADDSYSFERPRREGLIGLDQGTVYLPLRAGENELVLAVTDVFGGWGLMGLLGRVDSNAVAVSLRQPGVSAQLYSTVCWYELECMHKTGDGMRKKKLTRKAFYVDERLLRRAKKVLGLRSEGEVVRVSMERALAMEEFWKFMKETKGVLEPGSVESP